MFYFLSARYKLCVIRGIHYFNILHDNVRLSVTARTRVDWIGRIMGQEGNFEGLYVIISILCSDILEYTVMPYL